MRRQEESNKDVRVRPTETANPNDTPMFSTNGARPELHKTNTMVEKRFGPSQGTVGQYGESTRNSKVD
jgi:hypothetical protein